MPNKSKPNHRKQAQKERQQEVAPVTRRSMLKLARNGAIGAVAAAGVAYLGRGKYLKFPEENDLTRVGQGKPVVVQIHDPQCPKCTELQRVARQALKQFGECDLVYLVADIKQEHGQAFALRHRVPHVTLLLFDAEGQLRRTLSGPQRQADLQQIFAEHHALYAAS